MSEKIYKGDDNLVITFDMGKDVSAATDISLQVKLPDDTEVVWSEGGGLVTKPGDANCFTITVPKDYIEQVGTYYMQPKFTLAGWTGRAGAKKLRVLDHFEEL